MENLTIRTNQISSLRLWRCLNSRKIGIRGNLESTEKMTLRLVSFHTILFIRDHLTFRLKSQLGVENLTIRTLKILASLNLRKIGIRGKSGIHGKNDFKTRSFNKVDLHSRPNLTFIDLISVSTWSGKSYYKTKHPHRKTQLEILTMILI